MTEERNETEMRLAVLSEETPTDRELLIALEWYESQAMIRASDIAGLLAKYRMELLHEMEEGHDHPQAPQPQVPPGPRHSPDGGRADATKNARLELGREIERYCQKRLADLKAPHSGPRVHEPVKDGQLGGIREVMLFSARASGLEADEVAD